MTTGKGMRMLLVEDDPNDIELIKLALANCQFVDKIDIAEDGEKALEYLLGTPTSPFYPQLPRLVLLDLNLPKLNGIQVLEAIRNNSRTKKLVVVVMTSSAEDKDLQACYNLGVNSYIIKPLNFQEFRDTTQKISSYWMMLNEPPF
ncbi:MAG: response regulator [Crocosphaera sp.]|nr:response regulator [Crocosphaera sp.]